MTDVAEFSAIDDAGSLRQNLGAPVAVTVNKEMPFLDKHARQFIAMSPMLFISTVGADRRADVSPRGDPAGFVKVIDEKYLLFPDVAGNRLFQSYQNVDDNPFIGIIFFIPGINDTVRVNGKVTIVSKEDLEAQNVEVALYETDDRSKHLQGMLIEVEEAYTHCPRALNFSHLWDAEEIGKNKETSPIPERTDENYFDHQEGQ